TFAEDNPAPYRACQGPYRGAFPEDSRPGNPAADSPDTYRDTSPAAGDRPAYQASAHHIQAGTYQGHPVAAYPASFPACPEAACLAVAFLAYQASCPEAAYRASFPAFL